VGGGYISCGDFEGEDKSASALEGVIEDLQALVRWEKESPLHDLLSNMHAFVSGDRVPPEEWQEEIRITSDQMAALRPFLEKYHAQLIENAGTSDPIAAMEVEQNSSS